MDQKSQDTELSITGRLESALLTSGSKVSIRKTPSKSRTPVTQISSVKGTEDRASPDLKQTLNPIDIPLQDYSEIETKLFPQKTTEQRNNSQLLRAQKDLARQKLLLRNQASQGLKEIGEKSDKCSAPSKEQNLIPFSNNRFCQESSTNIATPEPEYYWDIAGFQKMLKLIMVKKFKCGIQESALKDFVPKKSDPAPPPNPNRKKFFLEQPFAIFQTQISAHNPRALFPPLKPP